MLLTVMIGILILTLSNIHTSVLNQYQKNQSDQKVPKIVKKIYPVTNLNTRPVEQYTRIGYLYSETGNSQNIIPLYGRRVYSGSIKWNYYINTVDHAYTVTIPIEYKGKKCDSEYGCDELYDDDSIQIPEYGGLYKVKLYDRSIKYMPTFN